MNLSFLHPGLLWGLLAAAIPVVIHLFFRRRPRPTPFPAIDFILRARRETERRLRLKKILLFAARTALLAAIALALARPRAERPDAAAAQVARGPRATAVVLDASASMGYLLGGRTLFDRARADALEALASLGGDEPATVVVCGSETPAAAAPSFDRAAVRRVLDEALLGAGHSDMTACVTAAVRALSQARAQASLPKRVVVATDLTASAWRLDVPPPMVDGPAGPVRPEVSLLDAARGAALPNAAVTGLEAEPDPAVGPRGYRITATLANFGAEPLKDVSVRLETGAGRDTRTAIRAFAEIPAGATAKKTFSYAFPGGGPAVITVALPPDPLAVDDARTLALVVPREVRVLVVNGAPSPIKVRDEAYFVETALASPGSPVRPKLVDAEGLAQEDLAGYDVVFLLNVRSLGARAPELARFVEKGGGLFLSLGDQVDPDLYARELGGLLPLQLHVVKTAADRGAPGSDARAARFAEVALAHPALSIFTGDAREGLLGTRTFRYFLTRPAEKRGEAPRVLAAFDDGAPALVEARRGQGRVLLFTSTADRDWTDWPIRTSYLPAMQRFAAYLAGGLEDRRAPPAPVGAPHAVKLEPGQTIAALVAPDGRELRGRALEAAGLDEGDPAVARFTPRLPGLWQVKLREGGAERPAPALAFAVWPDPRESDTRRLDAAELTAYFGGATHARVEGQASASAGHREIPLWTLLLALGLAAFFAEGVLLA
ncbi:MAG TPA: VWA domain-containing protein [Anaeromyxobacteraceae bacterium]|nr:VWA domain-containing protein [Anaeromyxobacteraceae bacterium]